MSIAESLSKCKVEGNVVYLPPISEGMLPNYPEVKKALTNAGGKYKKNSFVFNTDAQPYIDKLISGGTVNLKKEFQFFPTPDDIAAWLVELAEIQRHHTILEPSAGQGAIIDQIHSVLGVGRIYCYELMPENAAILQSKYTNVEFCGNDFLQADTSIKYDRIIANPPFSKNQDIDHIYKMYEVLAEGGRIVTIASNHWITSHNKKEKAFRDWLKEVDADLFEIERGRFKESGTLVGATVIEINK